MSKPEKKRVIANWYITCDASCPHCYHDTDLLSDQNDDNLLDEVHIQVGEEKAVKIEVLCDNCGKHFIVNHIQY